MTSSREKLTWALYGCLALATFATPHAPVGPVAPPKPPKSPSSPTKPPGSKTPPKGGGKQGDVISYYVDVPGTGLIVVKTSEAPDVQWGAPELRPEKVPAFQAMLRHWGDLVDEAGLEYRIPSKEIWAVMWSESGGKQGLTSNRGAEGLMQVMPFNFPKGMTKAQMQDPRTNIRQGTALLAQARAGGSRDLVQMASMYNAGPPAGPPRTNEQAPSIATRWGYVAQPGYIDSVVAAYNTAVKQGIS